jgi:hypothetical protein
MKRFKSILLGMLAIAFVGMLSSCAFAEIEFGVMPISLGESYKNIDNVFFGFRAQVTF